MWQSTNPIPTAQTETTAIAVVPSPVPGVLPIEEYKFTLSRLIVRSVAFPQTLTKQSELFDGLLGKNYSFQYSLPGLIFKQNIEEHQRSLGTAPL
jgi:hypothetical protein